MPFHWRPIETQHSGHQVTLLPPRPPGLQLRRQSASDSPRRRRPGWARRTAGRCGRCGCRAATAMPPSSPRTCPAAWPAPPRSTTGSRVRPGPPPGRGRVLAEAGSSRSTSAAERQGEQRSRPARARLRPVRGAGVSFSPWRCGSGSRQMPRGPRPRPYSWGRPDAAASGAHLPRRTLPWRACVSPAWPLWPVGPTAALGKRPQAHPRACAGARFPASPQPGWNPEPAFGVSSQLPLWNVLRSALTVCCLSRNTYIFLQALIWGLS